MGIRLEEVLKTEKYTENRIQDLFIRAVVEITVDLCVYLTAKLHNVF